MKAIIFDMDGVIADTEPLHFESLNMVLANYNIKLPDSSFGKYIGLSEEDTWKMIKSEYNLYVTIDELMRERRDYIFDLIERLKPAKRLYLLLNQLDKHKLALVSSSDRAIVTSVINKLKLQGYFDVIVTGDDVTNKKPDPEPYLLALRKLRLGPEDCIVIEDSPPGVKSAKGAGIRCIALTHTYRKDELQADFHTESIAELNLKTIKGVMNG